MGGDGVNPILPQDRAGPDLRRCRPLLGTLVEIAADRIEHIEAGFTAIATVHSLMTVHAPDSELSVLNRRGLDGPVPVHAWTAAVLERALFWAEASEGAFDPTVGGRLAAAGVIPRHEGHPPPDARANWRDVVLAGAVAWLRRPLLLDLGGIAKGFAVDQAAAAMTAAGAVRGLVNAGGDLRAFGDQSWLVALVDPRTRQPSRALRIRDAAVATSGVLPRRRGAPHLPRRARRWSSATVIAPVGMDADALTKVVLAGGRRAKACLEVAEAAAIRHGACGWEAVA